MVLVLDGCSMSEWNIYIKKVAEEICCINCIPWLATSDDTVLFWKYMFLSPFKEAGTLVPQEQQTIGCVVLL